MANRRAPIPTPDEILADLPEGEPMTAGVLLFCLPYSEVEQWARVLLAQVASGRSRFVGSPGFSERMAGLLSAFTGREIVDLFLNLTALDVPIMVALERARQAAH